MTASYKAELVGVFGHPVADNPTGVMMESAFAALGLNWRYLTIEVLPEDLPAAVQGMRAMQFAGINCTIPHKEKVLDLLDEVAPDARLMGAVNTVRRDGDRLIGENTDGKGFMRALSDAGVDPSGKRVVMLGAGGAARAVGVELALAGAERLTIVSRSVAQGEELSNVLRSLNKGEIAHNEWLPMYAVPEETDILLNVTPIGMYPHVEESPALDYATITPTMVVCDVIPNPPNTTFLRRAAERGARTLDGLGMLVWQGAIAFKMWTGQDAPVDVMRRALAQEFGLS